MEHRIRSLHVNLVRIHICSISMERKYSYGAVCGIAL